MPMRFVGGVIALLAAPIASHADGLCSAGSTEEHCRNPSEPPAVDIGVQLFQGGLKLSGAEVARQKAEAEERVVAPAVNCSEVPWMCSEPFHCERPVTSEETSSWATRGNGGATYRFWCLFKDAWAYEVPACVLKTDVGQCGRAIDAVLNQQGLQETFVNTCFSEGHCDDTEVTEDMPVEQVEKVCDKRFPNWRGMSQTTERPSHSGRTFCFSGSYRSMVNVCSKLHCRRHRHQQRIAQRGRRLP
mmetsp:Transcript_68395/g.154880  ORF Transcript_68395/g.154880 Transcript_68395/m.154880 type:complete len:245 (-) Transcript_68395:64-798(-)